MSYPPATSSKKPCTAPDTGDGSPQVVTGSVATEAAAGGGDTARAASKPAAPGAGSGSVGGVDPATIDGRQEAPDAGGGDTMQAPPAAATAGMRAAEHRSGGTAVDKEATPEVMVEQPPTGESGDREDSPGVQATDPALTEEAADTGAEALDLATS